MLATDLLLQDDNEGADKRRQKGERCAGSHSVPPVLQVLGSHPDSGGCKLLDHYQS